MTSLQKALAVVFDEGETRSFVRGRLISGLLVLGVFALMLVAVALSVVEGIAKNVSEDVQGALDWEPYGVGFLFGVVVPVVLTFGVFLALMRLLPRAQPSLRTAMVGAGLGAIAFQVDPGRACLVPVGPGELLGAVRLRERRVRVPASRSTWARARSSSPPCSRPCSTAPGARLRPWLLRDAEEREDGLLVRGRVELPLAARQVDGDRPRAGERAARQALRRAR